MNWWARVFRAKRRSTGTVEENLLVISDVHLGEDILIEGPEHLCEYIRALNRELAGFVAAHRKAPQEGRRWHLVINGDMFDFAKVSLRPEPEEAFQLWSEQVESTTRLETRNPGIPNTAENVVWKLERIIEIHRPLFRELATFLLDGHRITFIEGNHDAEFYFETVQNTLRETLLHLAEQVHRRERRPEPFDPQALAQEVGFRTWFTASPGRYHIEHGHQYDEFCSFEYQLAPHDGDKETLATPLVQRAMPYFVEYLGDFSTHGLDTVGFATMAKRWLSFGPRLFWILFRMYWLVVFELVRRAGPRRREELAHLKERHQAQLRAMVEQSPYGYDTLARLDELKSLPAEYSLFKMLRASYVDRFLVAGLMVIGIIPVFFLAWRTALVWGSVVLLLGVLSLWLLARARRRDLPAQLRKAAATIAAATGSRYVIFGHSHRPELVNLRERFGVGAFDEKSYYINSGSWVTREILLGEKGRGMTYVEITAHGAALKRWKGPEQESEVIEAVESQAVSESVREPDLREAARGSNIQPHPASAGEDASHTREASGEEDAEAEEVPTS